MHHHPDLLEVLGQVGHQAAHHPAGLHRTIVPPGGGGHLLPSRHGDARAGVLELCVVNIIE